ncbi:MAG: type II toxin-antitoxin system RelE/ParE family toxin [Arenicella sp.]
MAHTIKLTKGAVNDLEGLYEYIAQNDSSNKANTVLNKIENHLEALAQNPERGSYVRELLELGIKEYREIYFKPYRMIYRIMNATVYIYLIVDGRRNLQDLLQQRLLNH